MPSFSLAVPHCEQEFGYSCLAACVRMVLAFHGLVHGEDEVRALLGTGPGGTRLRDLTALASWGVGVRLAPEDLEGLKAVLAAGSPPIVFLDTGPLGYWAVQCAHVAVVVGIDDATVSLNDPYFGAAPQTVAHAAFLRAWEVNACYCAVLSVTPPAPAPPPPP